MADESGLAGPRDLTDLEEQRQSVLAEIIALRRTRDDLAEEIIAAEARHAQVAERTLEARVRRQILAGEVIALCGERAALIERISALRIAALELETSSAPAGPLPSREMVAPAVPAAMADPEPDVVSEPEVVSDANPEPDTDVAAGMMSASPPPPSAEPAPASGLRDTLVAPSGRVVARWSARARTTVKPRNDSYETGAQTLWRRSEDRIRLSVTGNGLLAAVSDGAGASGLYCGAWAETLVERLPEAPLGTIDDLNRWLDGFCLEFRQTMIAQCKADPPKHSKFVREGSFATLAACWLWANESGVTAHWIGYGDSPVLVFDRTGDEAELVSAHPNGLAAFDRDPHLLNWTVLPDSQRLSGGTVALPRRATVMLASDGIGQFLMLRHLAAAGPSRSPVGGALAGEFRRLAQSGSGRLAAAVKAHAARPGGNVSEIQASIRDSLASDSAFAAMVAARCEEGLLANDDSSLIMIDIDQGRL